MSFRDRVTVRELRNLGMADDISEEALQGKIKVQAMKVASYIEDRDENAICEMIKLIRMINKNPNVETKQRFFEGFNNEELNITDYHVSVFCTLLRQLDLRRKYYSSFLLSSFMGVMNFLLTKGSQNVDSIEEAVNVSNYNIDKRGVI